MTDEVAEAGAQLARLATLRIVNEYVERFHVGAQEARSSKALDELLASFHLRILRSLRLRSFVDGERIDAHVLEVKPDELRLVTFLEPTDPTERERVPEMILRVRGGSLLEPEPRSGVATYCLYQALRHAPGAAIVHDVTVSGDVAYLRRGPAPGAYDVVHARDIYKPCDASPAYRALLCAAVPRVCGVGRTAAGPVTVEWRHVLSVTSTVAGSFTLHDSAWAEAVASLLGSLYGSHAARRDALARARRPSPSKAKKKQR